MITPRSDRYEPADAAWERAELDKDLVFRGEPCELQRVVSGATRKVALRASIRDYQPAELLGGDGLQAGDSHVVISTS